MDTKSTYIAPKCKPIEIDTKSLLMGSIDGPQKGEDVTPEEEQNNNIQGFNLFDGAW